MEKVNEKTQPTKSWTSNDTSFFGIFDYTHLMHDAIDGGLVYENITITKNITTGDDHVLKKGDHYDAVWFMFGEGVFKFINWEKGSRQFEPSKDSVFISQAEIAPLLKW